MNKSVVLKFGGTSVATKDRILTLVGIVKEKIAQNPVVVVSAIRGVTDALISLTSVPQAKRKPTLNKIRKVHSDLAKELFSDHQRIAKIMEYIDTQLKRVDLITSKKSLNSANLDELVSYGEIMSSYIIAQTLRLYEIASEQVIATNIIITDNNYQKAEFMPKETERAVKKVLKPLISKGVVPVITGFIGSTTGGQTTTLGRGGSDYSASIIGYSLQAQEVQIWTDVDGIYTCDPRVVSSARLIPEISYKEASEMATFGAKVLHPKTIKPAIQKNIPVRVLNTFHPEGKGTLITAGIGTKVGFKAISFKKKAILANIYCVDMLLARGFLAKVFEIFARRNVSVDLVSVSEVSISVTLDNTGDLEGCVKELKKFSSVSINYKAGIVSLIGEKVSSSQHIIRDVAELFHQNNIYIRMISFGAFDTNISLVIDDHQVERVVRLIHDKILLMKNSKTQSIQLDNSSIFKHKMEVA